MDDGALLELSTALGAALQMCGAETYRVEESVTRLLAAYGVKGEVFAIPNCLIVSIEKADGTPLTRMQRSGGGGTDLDRLEQYNNLNRVLCANTPPVSQALEMLRETGRRTRSYRMPAKLLAHMIGAGAFAFFFRGSFGDGLCAAFCGLAVGLCQAFMDSLRANLFFKTIASGFILAMVAYALGIAGFVYSQEAVITGSIMLLVPGLLFTNSLRDIIYGDTMSGINRLMQVLIVSVAITMGTGAALTILRTIWGPAASHPLLNHSYFLRGAAAFVGCFGFCLLYNIHGPGMLFCLLGSTIGWGVCVWLARLNLPGATDYFIAAVVIALYSEIMARIRKYPASSYLVVSLFPLVPGSYIYYTMEYALQGNAALAKSTGFYTAEIAGNLAVGVLLVSTGFRMWNVWKKKRQENRV